MKVFKDFTKVGAFVPNDGSSTMLRPRLSRTYKILRGTLLRKSHLEATKARSRTGSPSLHMVLAGHWVREH